MYFVDVCLWLIWPVWFLHFSCDICMFFPAFHSFVLLCVYCKCVAFINRITLTVVLIIIANTGVCYCQTWYLGFLLLIIIYIAYTIGIKGQQYLGSNILSSHGFFQCVSLNARCYQNVFQRNSYSSFGLELTLLNIFILGVICLMQLNSVQDLLRATE